MSCNKASPVLETDHPLGSSGNSGLQEVPCSLHADTALNILAIRQHNLEDLFSL